MAPSITVVSAAQPGRTITFTYTAATGGMSDGVVTLAVPAGWSVPSTTTSDPGYATATRGTVITSGHVIYVMHVTMSAGQTLHVVYGSRAGGGTGATAPTSPGAQTWVAREGSTAAGVKTAIASSPGIHVFGRDGSGAAIVSLSAVSASSTGKTLTFTFTAGTGGTSGAAVSLAVPAGWSVPSVVGSAAGYTTAGIGSLTVSSRAITV